MTITDWPRSAAEPDPDSASPAAVSGTPEPVSRTPGTVSERTEFVSETESGTGTKPSPAKLTGTQKWTAGAIVAAALALAGIGLYLSFEHVAVFAFEQLRFESLGKGQLFAVGVDVGIMVMIAVDLLMAWLKRPISWIRYPVWLLTGATVVLNAASGAPKGAWKLLDYVAAGAHGVVPVLFITVVELGRDAIDRVVRPEQAERDSIPWLRWVLAPVATARIFRRMRLWGVTSYPEMIRRDQELIAYEQWLKRKYEGDITKATEDELLPMKMAPYGYTVAQALAMPDEQEQAAQERAEEAERRRLDAETRSEVAKAESEAERLRAKAKVELVQAEVDGQTGQARAHARAQVSAAERAAELEQQALDNAVIAEARAREAEAERKEAQERKAAAAADLEKAELERKAAEQRKAAAEADKVAAAEAGAIETERIAQARRTAAKADLEAAELERQAAQKRKEAAEADRVAAAEAQAIETQAIAEARQAAAEADRRAAETERAAAETRRAAAEADRKKAEEERRQAAALADIARSQKEAAEAERAAAETRRVAAEIERRAVEAEDAAKLKPRERAVRKVARMILAVGGDANQLPLADIQRELAVTSPGTASEYRQEAAELLAGGYRPEQ
ncbi:DUF2637 domain-containing protein [Streptomyces lancefieldiae]|uniref:DUF2637 domain-containing protein n=1 Tax=Streptomyces lancefieldiae TaxID=3075520 RepID=A0ABU3AWC2_9ACTN|nr:DUF2637 domain-containing protein [Streptomyces sp. DSM 40712]MDT0614454.1 DUF2637 domain-containing protein [Streptomyces sp. DSM 40712]